MHFNRDVFAANLRAARAKKDLSQDELAKISGVSKDAIFSYENGITTPGADKAYALSVALGITPNDLLGFSAN